MRPTKQTARNVLDKHDAKRSKRTRGFQKQKQNARKGLEDVIIRKRTARKGLEDLKNTKHFMALRPDDLGDRVEALGRV